MTVHKIIAYAWLAVLFLWLGTSVTSKPTVRTQSVSSRLVQLGLGILAYFLMFDTDLAVGPLAARFVPVSPLTSYIGLALTLAGIAFAIWARFFLGTNWSATVTVKQNHQLVRSGPYAIVRHPIYSGFTFALLGTAIELGQVRGIIAVILATITWRLKSRIEESFMIEQFGSQYEQYRHDVKALIPFVW